MKATRQWLIEASVPAVQFRTRFLVIAATGPGARSIASRGFPFGGWQPEQFEQPAAQAIRPHMAVEINVIGPATAVYIGGD